MMNENAKKVIEAALSCLGYPYVFGMWGRKCTPAVRRQYAGYNPSHKRAIFKACPVLSGKKPSCDGCKWQGKLAFDCRGFIYWCILQGYGMKLKGGGATSQYNTAANWVQRVYQRRHLYLQARQRQYHGCGQQICYQRQQLSCKHRRIELHRGPVYVRQPCRNGDGI